MASQVTTIDAHYIVVEIGGGIVICDTREDFSGPVSETPMTLTKALDRACSMAGWAKKPEKIVGLEIECDNKK